MQNFFYDLRYQVDKSEWRARAKRELVFQLFRRYRFRNNNNAKMLDLGCGTGVLQEEFEEKFDVPAYGIDTSKKAIAYCKKRGLRKVKLSGGESIPFRKEFFDVVTAIDVLEHIDDDIKALREIKRVLKKKGLAILLVPAHPYLWSTRDISLHHKRRYKVRELENKCKREGFKLLATKNVDCALYLLFSFICFLAPKKNGIPNLKMEVATASSNKFINETIFLYERFENLMQNFIKFPVGLSIAVVVQKV